MNADDPCPNCQREDCDGCTSDRWAKFLEAVGWKASPKDDDLPRTYDAIPTTPEQIAWSQRLHTQTHFEPLVSYQPIRSYITLQQQCECHMDTISTGINGVFVRHESGCERDNGYGYGLRGMIYFVPADPENWLKH